MLSFIHLLNKYLLSTYNMPDTALGEGIAGSMDPRDWLSQPAILKYLLQPQEA